MLEIVKKDGNACDFPKKMAELQIETVLKITDLACNNGIDPFAAIKIFSTQLMQQAADMQAHYKAKHGDEKTGDFEK